MTDPDSYAGGCYGWAQHDVPTLAGFLDEDLSTSWAQVSAWWQAHDVTAAHLEVLRDARAQIVEIWPPSISPASAAYVDQLDALIASMDNMAAAAASNAAALNGILTVLESARHKVDDLHAQWEQASPSWVVKASKWATPLGPLLQQDDERAMLNAQAAQVMTETDNSVYAYMPHLIVVQSVSTKSYPAPTPIDSGGGPGSGSPSGGGSVRRPVIPPAPPPARVDPSVDNGPLLSGTSIPSPSQQLADGSGGSSPSVGASHVLGANADSDVVVSPWIQTAAGRVLRSGAVLGSPPDSIRPLSDAPQRPTEPNREAPSGNGPGESAPGMWGGGIGAGRATDRRGRRALPPDTTWSVPRGVPPVLQPGPEPTHDPGPGVIGIDR